MDVADELARHLERASGMVWIQSDLQLKDPDRARQVLANAVEDMLELALPLDATWCLGDALVGVDVEALEAVAEASIQLLGRLVAPVYYVMGNHELDVRRRLEQDRYPLYERAVAHPDWHTHPNLEDFYFEAEVAGCRVFFLGDHAAEGGPWFTSHNQVRGGPDAYPHGPEAYARLRERMAASELPVITASHYAYPGGQRVGDLLVRLLPLPETVYLHCYGHAHVGDHAYSKKHPYRRENPVLGQPLPRQYNISALENRRSPGSHSALLLIEAGAPRWLAIRCHLERRWKDLFVIRPPHG